MSNAKFFEQPYPFESKTEGESKEQSVNPLYEEAYSDFAPRGKNGALNHSDDDDCAIDYSPEGSFFNPNEPSYRGRAGDTSWRASPYEKEAPGDPQKMIEDLGKMLEAVTRELARTRSSDRNFYSNRMPGTQEAPIEYTRLIGLKAPALKKLVDPLIERVDTDGDGFLSKKEVVAGVKNHDIEREEAILLCVIKSNLSDIEELSNDETGDENDGATRKDIMKVLDDLIDYNEKTSVAWAVGDYGQEHFQILDKDKDGFLTESEVRTGKGSTEEEIEALRNMRRLFNDIQSASNDEWGTDNNGLTKSDLEEYFGKEFDRHDWELMRKVENDIAGGALNLWKKVDALYADSENQLKSIRPEAVEQGGIGDCYFLAPLASMASSEAGKQIIKDMIRVNGVDKDGNRIFTVTFPAAPDEPITVAMPTDTENALFAGGSNYGNWVAVLEKAYGVYVNRSRWSKSDLPQDSLDGGSSTNAGLKILSSAGVKEVNPSKLSTQEIKELVATKLEEGKPMTISANNTTMSIFGLDLKNETETLKLNRGHAYSIIGIDTTTNTVIIRNPWGNGEPEINGSARDGDNDGIFQLSIDELKKDFNGLAYAK